MMHGAVAERPSAREVAFSRVFKAPITLVWKTITDVEHLHHWWGPDGFSITTAEFTLAPNGVWRFVMHGPDGIDYPSLVVFTEIVEPSLLVLENTWSAPYTPITFTITTTLAAEGEGTRFRQHMLFHDDESVRAALELYGVIQGGIDTANRLARLVESA